MNPHPRLSSFLKSRRLAIPLISGLSALTGFLIVLLATRGFEEYGVALFCGTPLVMGFVAPFVYGLGGRRHFLELLGVSVLAQIMLFAGMIIFAIEGIICVIMAAPLWLSFATVGTLAAWGLLRLVWPAELSSRGFPVAGLLLFFLLPASMGAEHLSNRQPPHLMVSTTIDIDAPPELVWQHILSFPDLPAPGWSDGGWLFEVGIARPLRAEIEGTGPGATRYCVFSTGRAVEPVRIWDENRLLEVDVVTTPPSMEETSIYPHLHPAHLEGYLVSSRARFELIPLPNGRTRVVGTSWYENRMFPVAYWRLWSDASIKAVQVHVLAHVKNLSETDARALSAAPFPEAPTHDAAHHDP